MFGFNFDRKFLYILLGCLALSSLIGFSQARLLGLLLTLPAVIIAIVIAIISTAIYMFSSVSFLDSMFGTIIDILLQQLIIINIGLGVFNLIPLPPLDGSKVFINLFSYKTRRWIIEHEQTFYYIFLALWITGLAGVIISPIIELLYGGLMNGVLAIFRLF